jgi:hypothetical protein
MCDGMGFTALHLASWMGEDEMVAELLNRGAFMDVQDVEVRIPLSVFGRFESISQSTPCFLLSTVDELAAELLNQGAFMDVQDFEVCIPLLFLVDLN